MKLKNTAPAHAGNAGTETAVIEGGMRRRLPRSKQIRHLPSLRIAP
jgi:hypothetical protein